MRQKQSPTGVKAERSCRAEGRHLRRSGYQLCAVMSPQTDTECRAVVLWVAVIGGLEKRCLGMMAELGAQGEKS